MYLRPNNPMSKDPIFIKENNCLKEELFDYSINFFEDHSDLSQMKNLEDWRYKFKIVFINFDFIVFIISLNE